MFIKRFLGKREEVVPFKGGLPRVPLVVGLIGKLPSGINNLIAKFIGFQSKPATELKSLIESAQTRGEIGRGEKPNQSYLFTPRQVPEYYVSRLFFYLGKVKQQTYIDRQYFKLKRLRSARKDEFLKLRRWVRKALIISNYWGLFPNNAENLKFINEQIAELNIEGDLPLTCWDCNKRLR